MRVGREKSEGDVKHHKKLLKATPVKHGNKRVRPLGLHDIDSIQNQLQCVKIT